MSVTYGFYNGVNGDRKYDSVQMSRLFDGIIMDGVFMSIGHALVVRPNAGMNIVVGDGRAWFNHSWTNNDTDLVVPIGLPDMLLNRYDAVVLEIDTANRTNTIKMVQGVAATTPVYPTLTRNSQLNQYPLAYVSVYVGMASVTAGDIVNMVGTSACPFVVGALQTFVVDPLIAQWQGAWNTWFASAQSSWGSWIGSDQTQWNTFINDRVTAWNSFVNDRVAAWNTFVNARQDAWNTFVNGCQSAWNSWFNSTSSAWSTWFNGTSSGWTTFLSGLPSQFGSTLSDINAKFSNLPKLVAREGGDPILWAVPHDPQINPYENTSFLNVAGAKMVVGSSSGVIAEPYNNAQITGSFSTTNGPYTGIFTQTPIILYSVMCDEVGSNYPTFGIIKQTESESGFSIFVIRTPTVGTLHVTVHWLAIGI